MSIFSLPCSLPSREGWEGVGWGFVEVALKFVSQSLDDLHIAILAMRLQFLRYISVG